MNDDRLEYVAALDPLRSERNRTVNDTLQIVSAAHPEWSPRQQVNESLRIIWSMSPPANAGLESDLKGMN